MSRSRVPAQGTPEPAGYRAPLSLAAAPLGGAAPLLAAALLLIALLAAPAFVAGQAAHAQDAGAAQQAAPEARTVTFEEAVRIALNQNTSLRRAQNDVQLQGARVAQQRADFLPNLQLSTSGTRTFGRSFSQEEGSIINETSDFFGANASASVNLFNGFEKVASLRRANLTESASALLLERTRQDVVFQVIDGYVALLQNRQLEQVRVQEIAVQRDLLRQVEALVEVGRRPRSDLYQQQAALAEAQAARAAEQREVFLAETRIIQVLQLDPRGTYAFEAPALTDAPGADALDVDTSDAGAPGGIDTTVAFAEASYDLDQLLDAAFVQRADLDAVAAGVGVARQSVRVARSGYWPSLSLSVGYGSDWSGTALVPVPGTATPPRTVTLTPDGYGPVTFEVPGTGNGPAFQRPAFFNQLNARRGGPVRLALTFPLFERLQTRTSVAESEVALQNARYDLQDQQLQVALQVRQAVLDYRSARTQLNATQERLQAARRAQEAARQRYELGAATFVELAQATTEFVSARSARVRTQYSVLLAQKLIDYYTGRLDTRARLLP